MFGIKYSLCEEGEGGSSSGTNTGNEEALKAEVERLRNHSNKLLDEKKHVQAQLKAFEGIDPENVKKMMETFNSSEEAKLIAEGNLDQVVAKRIEKQVANYTGDIEKLQTTITEIKESADTFKNKYNSLVIDSALRSAAEKARVRPEAIEDVLLRAKGVFTIGEDDSIESRDKEGNLRKVGNKLLDPALFVETLKDTAAHFWPESEGIGASGKSTGSYNGKNPWKKGTPDYNLTEQVKLMRTDPQLAETLKAAANAH